MSFESICRAIKEVRIQGARAVAEAGVKALLLRSDKAAIKRIISLRPTEPALRNAVRYALSFPSIKRGVQEVLKHFELSSKIIADIGARKIKSGMTVFTHCHSSTVLSIMRKAKAQGKRFTVWHTESRPLYQGRLTATDLSKAKIPAVHIVDSAAKLALRKADLFLFGADAITADGNTLNKIGTDLFAELANKYGVPCYCCSGAWKFDPATIFGEEEKIEQRPTAEIWPKPPKGIKIINPAFEIVQEGLLDGIISELGVLTVGGFISQVRKVYPFMFLK